MRWPKYWSFSFSIIPSKEHPRLISFRMDWLDLLAKYILQNSGLDEAQAGNKIARRNINNFRYADDTTVMAGSEEELKSLLMKVKEESEKAAFKLNI